MASVSKKHIESEICRIENQVNEFLEKNHVEQFGRIPVIFVYQESARRFYVGWNFQQKTAKIGDVFSSPDLGIQDAEIKLIFKE